ncbi:MAG: phosphatase PAP2 family protein [Reichenbachiella sp.]
MNQTLHLRITTLLALVMVISSCASNKHLTDLENFGEGSKGRIPGYMTLHKLPSSITLLPPAPAEGSPMDQMDKELNQLLLNNTDSMRLTQATKDAILYFPEAIDSFTKIVDIDISAKNTPYLYVILKRTLTDAAMSTYLAKQQYKRPRPYMVNGKSTCTPESEAHMSDGSYPSGHAAVGWAWALILTEVFPDKTNHLLKRGRDFGDSRAVCNVHWMTDVIEGRTMGAATVAKLHGNDNFMADLQVAKSEVAELLK